ncbi:MAG: single-stranded-DNA-specific exonuclease RecJ [bacterium]
MGGISWRIKPVDQKLVREISATAGISELIAQLLILRGVRESSEVQMWLSPSLNQLHPAHLLPDFSPAVARIFQAIDRKEPILIWGHDDLDGITAVVVLGRVLTGLQAVVGYHIPTKGKDKHGLNPEFFQRMPESNCFGLIITVDCGITNDREIKEFKYLGKDVIVTDHHEVIPPLPPSVANVDPKREDSDYPYSELTGAGVALKLSMGLIEKRLGLSPVELLSCQPELLVLVTLGTIADRAPLTGENRVLVAYGLRALEQTRMPALRAVLKALNFSSSGLESGFAGVKGSNQLTVSRLLGELLPLFASANGVEGVRNLLSADTATAQAWVNELIRRREAWRIEAEQTLSIAQENVRVGDGIIFVQHPGLSLRCLGFSAARLKDKYQLPAVVLGRRGDVWVGECRGMEGVDLMDLLRALRGYFIDFGGHKKAAGFSILDERLADFIRAAERFAHENFASRIVPEDPFLLDALLPLQGFDSRVTALAPFGEGNPQPVFLSDSTGLVKTEMGVVPETRPNLIVEPGRYAGQIQHGKKYSLVYTVDDLGRLSIIDLKPLV